MYYNNKNLEKLTKRFGNVIFLTLSLIHNKNHMNDTVNIGRKRKSEKLTSLEQRALKKYVYSFPTVYDASCEIGIHRNTLDLVLIKGQGSPETIHKIREKITQSKAA